MSVCLCVWVLMFVSLCLLIVVAVWTNSCWGLIAFGLIALEHVVCVRLEKSGDNQQAFMLCVPPSPLHAHAGDSPASSGKWGRHSLASEPLLGSVREWLSPALLYTKTNMKVSYTACLYEQKKCLKESNTLCSRQMCINYCCIVHPIVCLPTFAWHLNNYWLFACSNI